MDDDWGCFPMTQETAALIHGIGLRDKKSTGKPPDVCCENSHWFMEFFLDDSGVGIDVPFWGVLDITKTTICSNLYLQELGDVQLGHLPTPVILVQLWHSHRRVDGKLATAKNTDMRWEMSQNRDAPRFPGLIEKGLAAVGTPIWETLVWKWIKLAMKSYILGMNNDEHP